jgi:hypothetical protein
MSDAEIQAFYKYLPSKRIKVTEDTDVKVSNLIPLENSSNPLSLAITPSQEIVESTKKMSLLDSLPKISEPKEKKNKPLTQIPSNFTKLKFRTDLN